MTDPVRQLARIHAMLVDPGLRTHVVAVNTGGGRAAKRCVSAVQSAAESTGTGTKAGCDAAIGRLGVAGKEFQEVLRYRGDQPHAEPVADVGVAALKALQDIDWTQDAPEPGTSA